MFKSTAVRITVLIAITVTIIAFGIIALFPQFVTHIAIFTVIFIGLMLINVQVFHAYYLFKEDKRRQQHMMHLCPHCQAPIYKTDEKCPYCKKTIKRPM